MSSQILENLQQLDQSTRPQDSREQAKQLLQQLQDDICQGLEELDSQAKFREDSWQREKSGRGRTI